ncbi:MAG: RsmD family RNA methyltransferase [bacterium]
MQIRAGRLKGRRLTYPRAGLRPTKDITRQAMFNIIGSAVRGARVGDFFAGDCSTNTTSLAPRDSASNTKVVRAEALATIKRLGADRFDILLADPPYRNGLVQVTLDRAVAAGTIPPGGLFVVEHHELEPPACPEGWVLVKRGRYGDSHLTVLRRNDD